MDAMHDVLGIGFGPANLSLAIGLHEAGSDLKARFIEARPGPSWQDAMMLPGSDIQNHPVRDLVSLRNPRSRYSFINFLFEHDRLLEHLNLPAAFPLRKEYAQYFCWVASHFADVVDYDSPAGTISVELDEEGSHYYAVTTRAGRVYRARSLVVGTGRTPYVPEPFDTIDSPRVFHLTDYLPALQKLGDQGIIGGNGSDSQHIVIIGGSQSAVELALDINRRFPSATVSVYARPYSLREKDGSPFSEEGYFPQYTDYYYRASRERKATLDSYMRLTNYSAADGDVLRELYTLIYEQRLDGDQRLHVRGSRQVRQADVGDSGVRLQVEELITGGLEETVADVVVLATGFRDLGPGPAQEQVPPLLRGLTPRLAFDDYGYLKVAYDYEVSPADSGLPPLFLNGLCESSHGIGDSGSFSLLSLRAKMISDGLRKRLSR